MSDKRETPHDVLTAPEPTTPIPPEPAPDLNHIRQTPDGTEIRSVIQWNCHRRHRGLPMEKLATDTLHAEYDKLLFAARRSVRYVRYHRHRQRFLDRVHDLGALRTAFGGSATVAAVVADLPAGWTWVLPTLAALTAFAGAHELVFGTARGARRHDALARDFVMLEEELLRARPTLTPEPLIKLQTRHSTSKRPSRRSTGCWMRPLTTSWSRRSAGIRANARTSRAGSACGGTCSMSERTESASRLVDRPSGIAVKVINRVGDEVTKVFQIQV